MSYFAVFVVMALVICVALVVSLAIRSMFSHRRRSSESFDPRVVALATSYEWELEPGSGLRHRRTGMAFTCGWDGDWCVGGTAYHLLTTEERAWLRPRLLKLYHARSEEHRNRVLSGEES